MRATSARAAAGSRYSSTKRINVLARPRSVPASAPRSRSARMVDLRFQHAFRRSSTRRAMRVHCTAPDAAERPSSSIFDIAKPTSPVARHDVLEHVDDAADTAHAPGCSSSHPSPGRDTRDQISGRELDRRAIVATSGTRSAPSQRRSSSIFDMREADVDQHPVAAASSALVLEQPDVTTGRRLRWTWEPAELVTLEQLDRLRPGCCRGTIDEHNPSSCISVLLLGDDLHSNVDLRLDAAA